MAIYKCNKHTTISVHLQGSLGFVLFGSYCNWRIFCGIADPVHCRSGPLQIRSMADPVHGRSGPVLRVSGSNLSTTKDGLVSYLIFILQRSIDIKKCLRYRYVGTPISNTYYSSSSLKKFNKSFSSWMLAVYRADPNWHNWDPKTSQTYVA